MHNYGKRKKKEQKGELKIGNEANAILQLQASQADPLLALREIVNNGIDQNDNPIISVIRFKRKQGYEILIEDNGKGIPPGEDGNCDMKKVATSICDSRKALFTESEREKDNIVGKFAIGLLGFASIGKFVEVISRCHSAEKTRVLRLKKGSVDYSIEDRGKLSKSSLGTSVRIFPVHESIVSRFTVEKLNYFFRDVLSERLIETGTKLTIQDRVSKKSLEVKPYYYKGDKITIKNVALPPRNDEARKISVDLYINPKQDANGKVAVLSQGVKILDNITEMHEFNVEPWNNPLLEGKITNTYLTLPPTTRYGIVPDDNLTEFIFALGLIEDDVKQVLKEAEEKKEQKLNKAYIKDLKNSVKVVMNNLSEEYSWFGLGGSKVAINAEVDGKVKSDQIKKKKKFNTVFSNGPLSFIRVDKKFVVLLPGETVTINASAWTIEGHQIPSGVHYKWDTKSQFMGDTKIDEGKFTFTAGTTEGKLRVKVTGSLSYGGSKQKDKKSVDIEIVSEKEKKKIYQGARFPIPRSFYRPGEHWRSRWSGNLETIEYNTGHPDYKIAEKKGKKGVVRYLQKIYAKHIVLHNFKGQSDDKILERMIEVMTLFDSVTELNGVKSEKD